MLYPIGCYPEDVGYRAPAVDLLDYLLRAITDVCEFIGVDGSKKIRRVV
jgi:hypothetical protein